MTLNTITKVEVAEAAVTTSEAIKTAMAAVDAASRRLSEAVSELERLPIGGPGLSGDDLLDYLSLIHASATNLRPTTAESRKHFEEFSVDLNWRIHNLRLEGHYAASEPTFLSGRFIDAIQPRHQPPDLTDGCVVASAALLAKTIDGQRLLEYVQREVSPLPVNGFDPYVALPDVVPRWVRGSGTNDIEGDSRALIFGRQVVSFTSQALERQDRRLAKAARDKEEADRLAREKAEAERRRRQDELLALLRGDRSFADEVRSALLSVDAAPIRELSPVE